MFYQKIGDIARKYVFSDMRIKIRTLRLKMRRIKKRIKVRSKIALGISLKKPLKSLQFEVHLVEHCNLNCAGCDNFSSLANPEFLAVSEFEKDFTRLRELFGDNCQRIYLMGGEPLLHPNLIEFLEISRLLFPNALIMIITNGILLSSLPIYFWEKCHKHQIDVGISRYPIHIEINAIKERAMQHGVSVQWFGGDKDNRMHCYPLDLSGVQNFREMFGQCERANTCITLKHGKLYPCSCAPHIEHFNKYFDVDLQLSQADSIDIYEVRSGEEILKRLSLPIPFCRYCALNDVRDGLEWHTTQKKITEWI